MSVSERLTAMGLIVATGGLFTTIIHHFLAKEDAAQQRQIDAIKEIVEKEIYDRTSVVAVLFQKHDLDAAALQALDKHVASNHYEKNELDRKFDKIESAITDGFKMLNIKFDQLGCGKTKQGSCEK